MVKNLHLRIYGRVQGVSFRYYTLHQARLRNIRGYVKNEPDGSVFVEAEGDEEALSHFVQWCHEGPRWAIVENVEIHDGKVKDYNQFTIK